MWKMRATYRTVSIHAPRVGCDKETLEMLLSSYVSIHAPRVGCDRKIIARWAPPKEFQFTHPAWGATLDRSSRVVTPVFQFTHPVWGATQWVFLVERMKRFQFTHPVWGATESFGVVVYGFIVSIHAPRVGCDRKVVETSTQ